MLWLQALGVLSSFSANRRSEAAQKAALDQTAKGYVQQMNFSFQNAEIQRQSAFDAAVNQMTQVRLQASRQQGNVNAAVNEDHMGGGRTADALKRSVANDAARAASSITTNYKATNREINLNKIATLVSTQNAIQSLPSVQEKGIGSYLLDGVKAYYSGSGKATTSNAIMGSLNKSTGDTNTDWGMSTYSLFSPKSLFATNPVANWYNYQQPDLYSGASYTMSLNGGGDTQWGRSRLML